MMIPNSEAYELDEDTLNDFEEESVPDKTYRIDLQAGVISGMVDGAEAKKQAIMKILLTEAEEYLIYDSDYGCRLWDIYGSMPPYVISEAKDRITEGILNDDRFESVEFTDISYDKGKLTMSLTVACVTGEEIDMEGVEVNV